MVGKVLVTGASGFVGRATVRALHRNGWQVVAAARALPRQADEILPDEIERVAIDLHDVLRARELLDKLKPTHLLHLAWCTEHGRYWTSPENLTWVSASLDLVRAFREAGGARVVVAGTCAEYDWAHGYCSEEITPLEPHSLYGVAKNGLRAILESYLRGSGVAFAWARLFSPYGPAEYHARLVPSVINAVLDGRAVHCTHGKQYRDFLYIDDVANAFCRLLDIESEGSFNISSAQPVRIHEIVTKIGSLANWRGTPDFGAIAAPSNDPPMLVGDNRKLLELGWSPRIALDEGLANSIAWWRTAQRSH